jgi:hypothetical protein
MKKCPLRAAALAAGIETYVSGATCKHGHPPLRHTNSRTCCACSVENNRRCHAKRQALFAADPAAASEYHRAKHAKAWPLQRESTLQRRAQRKAQNLEAHRAYMRDYQRRRRADDEMFAIKDRLRGLVLAAFKRNGFTPKSAKTVSILGCDWPTVKAHIESQFTPGMTWENRGEWEIDHRLPLALAMSADDISELCHYTNLQPLWAAENRKKGARL